ncbi:MAG: hypothetical protein H6822_04970 [Planctomycetaceae bacterium]|nr:hypothetical protein [Planctomycetales bacterium]MCB9921508.1 hypothetical protein [Planctomycetaceae bacterium]
MRLTTILTLCLLLPLPLTSVAEDGDANAVVQRVVAAAGGEAKLFRLFKITEQLNVSSDPNKKSKERISVLEPPEHWWLGRKDRVQADKEPATFLVWAWTLGALVDAASKIEIIPAIVESEKPVVGLRISEAINPPMELYFDQETSRLLRIDWRSDIHRFSNWKQHNGTWYPATCVGYKKASGKPWYFTEIIELERLDLLPDGLQR